jgi:hypothetical protein
MTRPRTWSRQSGTPGSIRRHGRHRVDLLVMLLLVVGFFLGPLKLLGASWVSYLSADGLALLVLLVVFGDRIASRKPLIAVSPLSVPLVLLAAVCVLELANPEAPLIRSVLGLRSWLFYLSFFFVGLYTLRSVEQLERLYAVLLVLGLVTAAYGIYQWRAGPQSFANWSEYYGRYASLAWIAQSGLVFRAFSTFVAAGTFGGNMALLMVLAFSVAASPRITIRWRMVAAVTFAVMGVGIAASGSRGAIAHLLLASAVALMLIPGIRRRVTVVFMAVVMAGVAAVLVARMIGPVVTERFATIFDPQDFFWKWFIPLTIGLQIAQEHPFGMGLGYTAGLPQFISNPVFQDLPFTNVDSGYGSAAAELGFLGLGLFTYFAFKVGIEGVRTWKRLPAGRLRDLLLGPALFAATYPIVSVIFQPQATLPSSIYFWLLIGMLMKAPALQRALDADQLLRS